MTSGAIEADAAITRLEQEARETSTAAGPSSAIALSFVDAIRDLLGHLSADPATVVRMWPSDLPEWVQLGLAAEFAAWCGGSSETCVHEPDVNRGDPAVSAARRPGALVCLGCAGHRDEGETRCDGCGRPDVDAVVTIVFGPLAFEVCVCDDCSIGGLLDGDIAILCAS
ncbi:hypothetical protein [Gordonia sp. NPDC003585]|uniref:hypothetical protein n=1 Tax=Gordonia sp. NPDC003585 TaxID=3154275 RepID=UPI0033B6E454